MRMQEIDAMMAYEYSEYGFRVAYKYVANILQGKNKKIIKNIACDMMTQVCGYEAFDSDEVIAEKCKNKILDYLNDKRNGKV